MSVLLGGISLVIGLWMAIQFALRWLAPLPAPADEEWEVPTADGWTLRLFHSRATPGSTPRGAPVVLAHGFTMNRACWELSPRASFVRALTDRGHDVWVAHYRGDPGTRPPARPHARWRWGLHELVEFDLPALIGAVCQHTGAHRIAWVGHSMGGMLAYLYVGRFGASALDRVVTLGSPVTFRQFRGVFGTLAHLARRVATFMEYLPVRALSHMGLVFVAWLPGLFLGVTARSEHLSVAERLALVVRAFVNPPTQLTSGFLDMEERRQILVAPAAAGWEGFEAFPPGVGALERLTVPALIIAGLADRLAPPRTVLPAARIAGDRARSWVVGEDPSEGCPALGHGDLISSTWAVSHVAPRVSDFLGES